MSSSPADGAAVPRQLSLGPKVAVTGAEVCWPPSALAPPALVEASSRERGIGETLSAPTCAGPLPA